LTGIEEEEGSPVVWKAASAKKEGSGMEEIKVPDRTPDLIDALVGL
jgi:hypothetical protein